MAGLLNIQPFESPGVAGAKPTFGEAVSASFKKAQPLVGAGRGFDNEIYQPITDVLKTVVPESIMPGGIAPRNQQLSKQTQRDLHAQNFRPDNDLLGRVNAELVDMGLTPAMEIDAFNTRRDGLIKSEQENREKQDQVLAGASPTVKLLSALAGGIGAEFTDPVNLTTLLLGAPAKAGLLATVGIEAVINAGIEGAQTGGRNRMLEKLGEEPENVLLNMASGAVFGAGGVLGLRGAGKGIKEIAKITGLTNNVKAKETLIKLAETLEKELTTGEKLEALRISSAKDLEEITARFAGEKAERDAIKSARETLQSEVEDEKAAITKPSREATVEHNARTEAATEAALEGKKPDMDDRPAATTPDRTIIDGQLEEVNPADLLVQPKVFQFKSEGTDPGGVTPKLKDVKVWDPMSAGTVLVYEYADGSRAIADGHQRVALANRIMAQDPKQKIKLAATVLREDAGFSVDDARALGALKNVREAADGMTSAMATDAAKLLRIRPEFLRALPDGPGIAKATSLSRLSDDAFELLINNVIPQRFAEIIGRVVDDVSLHGPIARLLERTDPETVAQAESIVSQAMAAPTSTEKTIDLFGENEVTESLFLERAKVLERTLKTMREDQSLFKTLTDQTDKILDTGRNSLDKKSNAAARQSIENALASIKALAYRAGPISEALNDGAKTFKETGRLKDAAKQVAAIVRQEIERNGFDSPKSGLSRQAAKPTDASSKAPDPLETFADPRGEGAQEQVRQTRLVANEKPPEAFSKDLEGRAEVAALIEAGADRAEIDNHPAVVEAIARMNDIPETSSRPGYGSTAWHEKRMYNFNGEAVVGTEAAVARWVDEAETLAADALGVPPTPIVKGKELTIILGPPAAGKSTIANEVALGRGAAILDSDAIKETIPEFARGIGANAVHKESGDLIPEVEAVLMGEGSNIVFPKVGSKTASIDATIARYKKAGYEVRLINMAVTKENAYKRMIARFAEKGRLVPPKYLDEVGDKPSAVFRELKGRDNADGYAEIDNNGGIDAPRAITETQGKDPFEGGAFDLTTGKRSGQSDDAGRAGESAEGDGRPRSEATPEGQQQLIPGVEPITPRDRLQAGQNAPLRAGQDLTNDTQIGGLFDPADPARFDLFDQVPVGHGKDADGLDIALTKSRAELARELDQHDEFIEQLEVVCMK